MSDEFDPNAAARKAMGEFSEATDDDVGAAVDDVQDAPAETEAVEEATSRPRTRQDLKKFALEPASKSHRDVDAHDFLDLEEGGRNRLVLVFSDYLGSDLPPRAYQFCVGLVEELFGFLDGLGVDDGAGDDVQDDGDDGDDAPPLTEVDGV